MITIKQDEYKHLLNRVAIYKSYYAERFVVGILSDVISDDSPSGPLVYSLNGLSKESLDNFYGVTMLSISCERSLLGRLTNDEEIRHTRICDFSLLTDDEVRNECIRRGILNVNSPGNEFRDLVMLSG